MNKQQRGITVFSAFEGIGATAFALHKANVKVDTYFYSEVDPFALMVLRRRDQLFDLLAGRFVNVGDIKQVTYINGRLHSPALRLQGFKRGVKCSIDLLVGGFPCPSFSLSGKKAGFSDERGQLAFELKRLQDELKPKFFLAENTYMRKEHEDAITNMFGMAPIKLDAAEFSAQSRRRNYWTNIPTACVADSKLMNRCVAADVLEDNTTVDAKYFLSQKIQDRFLIVRKNSPACGPMGTTLGEECTRHGQRDAVYGSMQKMGCLTATDYKQPKQIAVRLNSELRDRLQTMGLEPGESEPNYAVRKLTPVECERLQGFDDNYTRYGLKHDKHGELRLVELSDTQRYKLIGNAFSVPTVSALFASLRFVSFDERDAFQKNIDTLFGRFLSLFAR